MIFLQVRVLQIDSFMHPFIINVVFSAFDFVLCPTLSMCFFHLIPFFILPLLMCLLHLIPFSVLLLLMCVLHLIPLFVLPMYVFLVHLIVNWLLLVTRFDVGERTNPNSLIKDLLPKSCFLDLDEREVENVNKGD
jgi:hypothetical protein